MQFRGFVVRGSNRHDHITRNEKPVPPAYSDDTGLAPQSNR